MRIRPGIVLGLVITLFAALAAPTGAQANAPKDRFAPTVSVTAPTNGSQVSGTSVLFNVNATDDRGVTEVKYWLDGREVRWDGTGPDWSWTWNSTTVADGTHTLYATAGDASGKWGTSATISFTVANSADTTDPSVPTGLTANAVSTSQINLQWNASVDNVGGSGLDRYVVYRGMQIAGSVPAPGTSFSDMGLTPGTPYTYTVIAVDRAGNESNASTPASATTFSNSAGPTVTLTAPANGATVSGTAVPFNATASDPDGVTQLKYYVDGFEVQWDGSGPDWSWAWNSTSHQDGAHTVFAKAADSLGIWGTSETVTITVDNTDPTVPTGLNATAVSSSQIDLQWQPSSDAATAVTSYVVYRDNVAIKTVSAPTTSYSDTGRSPNTTYTYAVSAVDRAGNESALSTSDSETTPGDTAGPTVTLTAPTNGATVSGTAVPFNATASDPDGVTQLKYWVDGREVRWDGTGPDWSWTWNSTTVADGTHTVQASAGDSLGNWAGSNTITITVANSGNPGLPRVRASGRNLVNSAGAVLPKLKGFNIHCATFSTPGFVFNQQEFHDIYAQGGRILRTVVQWNSYERQQNVLYQTAIDSLDEHVRRARLAGLYVILELHLNTGNIPTWATNGASETAKYANHGRFITEELAKRYANDTTVIGFGLNEPPLDTTTMNGNNAIPYLEGVQRQMIGWFRTYAPNWIGFPALAYANQTPYLADPRVDADPNAYDAYGNVVLDVHDYYAWSNSELPDDDGRQANGAIHPTGDQGGRLHWLGIDDPHNYWSTATHQSQMRAYLAPYRTFTTTADIPLMIGEFGWKSGATGKSAYYPDKRAAMDSAQAAIEIHWIYGYSDAWAARPGGTWDPDVVAWLKAP